MPIADHKSGRQLRLWLEAFNLALTTTRQLPLELKTKIYKYILDDQKDDEDEVGIGSMRIDPDDDTVTSEFLVERHHLHIRAIWSNIYYLPRNIHANLDIEFAFSAESKITTYSFSATRQLKNFSNLLKHVHQYHPGLSPSVHIVFFAYEELYDSLMEWKLDDKMPHGFNEVAAAQVEEWIDATKDLPDETPMHITLRYPWRNYLELNWLTTHFRHKFYDLVANVTKENWIMPGQQHDHDPTRKENMQVDHHIRLSIDAIINDYPDESSRDDKRYLQQWGCRLC